MDTDKLNEDHFITIRVNPSNPLTNNTYRAIRRAYARERILCTYRGFMEHYGK